LQAKRFARAIFEIAREHDDFESWLNYLQKFNELARQEEVISFLENPRFSVDTRIYFISGLMSGLSQQALNFLRLLIGKAKFSIVGDVLAEYQRLMDEYNGIEQAEITTAVELSNSEIELIKNNLESLTGKKIKLIHKTDPALIGGILIRVEGKLIDGSTATQLAALKKELAGMKG